MKIIYFTYKHALWYSSKWIEYKRFEKKVKYNVIGRGKGNEKRICYKFWKLKQTTTSSA